LATANRFFDLSGRPMPYITKSRVYKHSTQIFPVKAEMEYTVIIAVKLAIVQIQIGNTQSTGRT
jgi:hypothetical protein